MRFFFIISVALLIAVAPFSHPVGATQTTSDEGSKAIDDTRGAMDFIQTLSEKTKEIWSDQMLTAAEREKAFKVLFKEATDVPLLSQAMLGRHYRTASPELRQAYMTVMTDYIVTEFNNRMTQIGFKELKVIGSVPAPGRRGHVYIKTEIDREQGGPILADWRVRKNNGKFQIVNLEVEGINLVVTNREYFSSRIKTLGSLENLITELEASYQTDD